MFSTNAVTSAIVLSSALLAHAIVTPSAPGPGDSFNAGTTCKTVWTGDSVSPTAWKNMAIELMSGDNQHMVHITTVATGQDGTVDGSFEFPCPEVAPNSAIYFFQYSTSTLGAANLTWTTRFTIASATGETTDPENATQPDGEAISWGVGDLVDPSKATAPPSYLAGVDSIAGASSAASGGAAAASGAASGAATGSGANVAAVSNTASAAGNTAAAAAASNTAGAVASATTGLGSSASVSKSSAAPSSSTSGKPSAGMKMEGAASARVFAGIVAALAVLPFF